MDWLTNPEAWIALLTLTILEIVLGIDNVVFISVLVQRLPAEQRDRARTIGLGLAMGMRILLLLTISWIVGLKEPLFTIGDHGFSVRDLILIAGGLFLMWKAVTEIHEALEGDEGHATRRRPDRHDGVGPDPDRPAGHRVLAGLRADRGRHGRGHRRHGRRPS